MRQASSTPPSDPAGVSPEPVAPVCTRVKELHQVTWLVQGGKAAVCIVAPAGGLYRDCAAEIQRGIESLTGVRVPVVSDLSPDAAVPIRSHLVVLGNRSTNQTACALYDLHFLLTDLRYPGRNGYEVRTLHNPFGNGYNVVLIGGSDQSGVEAGTRVLLGELRDAGNRPGDGLALGWTMKIRLGDGLVPPAELGSCETWDASRGYGSRGYFGWNSISKRMALYYMTGEPRHAREVVRLAFPDQQAQSEMERLDGELIEDKRDPVAGPYHYGAHQMILYWDLIEESPVFSDDERLRITNAFARQVAHGRGIELVCRLTAPPARIGSRHEEWAAMCLYCLARYFARDYPDPVWQKALAGARWFFSPLHHPPVWVAGESQDLFWYGTGLAPVLSYLVLSRDPEPRRNGALAALLRAQEILITGRRPDWATDFAALNMFQMAAYLTGDGRWLCYRERTGIDTGGFRVGQSFWPDASLSASEPTDMTGRWNVERFTPAHWRSRESDLSIEQAFQYASYRSAADDSGDFVLLKGYNSGRELFHTCSIWELRLAGRTLLSGAENQVFTRAGGIVPSHLSQDAVLQRAEVLGLTAGAVTVVPRAGVASWQRTLALRSNRYALIVDALACEEDQPDLEILLGWSFDSAATAANPPLAVSQRLHVETAGAKVAMTWRGAVKGKQPQRLFSLLGVTGGRCTPIGDNAAALALPEPAMAVVGEHEGVRAGVAVVASDHLWGLDVECVAASSSASGGAPKPLLVSDAPVDVDWDFDSGELVIQAASPVTVHVAGGAPAVHRLKAGRHRFGDCRPDPQVLKGMQAYLESQSQRSAAAFRRLKEAWRAEQWLAAPGLTREIAANVGGPVANVIDLPDAAGGCLALAQGASVVVSDRCGRVVRRMATDGPVRVLHYWPEPRLLIAGCEDEKVIAFDERGRRAWEFVSQIDPVLLTWGKRYWYKSAPGLNGIHGLYSADFLDQRNLLYVGSCCTLEILTPDGMLVRRLPVLWGTVTLFQVIPGPGGSLNLLIGREHCGYNRVPVMNNRSLDAAPRGFHDVPPGATYIDGWCNINRHYLFYEELAGDGRKVIVGDVNGAWNRLQVWDIGGGEGLRRFQNELQAGVLDRDVAGRPLYDASFGPGPGYMVAPGVFTGRNVRAMAVADIDGDGRQEVIVALWNGYVLAFNHKLEKRWGLRLPSPPTALRVVDGRRLVVGAEDGTVAVIDDGHVTHRDVLPGSPGFIHVLPERSGGPRVFVITPGGEVAGFRLP